VTATLLPVKVATTNAQKDVNANKDVNVNKGIKILNKSFLKL